MPHELHHRRRNSRSRCWLLGRCAVVGSRPPAPVVRISSSSIPTPIPRALPPTATLDQVVNIVNDNSCPRAIALGYSGHNLHAGLSVAERQHRARATAIAADHRARSLARNSTLGRTTSFSGSGWRSRSRRRCFMSATSSTCTSAARQIMPVEPEWLIDAFGLVTFDRAAHLEGPAPVGNGRVEIRSRSGAPGRNLPAITVDRRPRRDRRAARLRRARACCWPQPYLSKHAARSGDRREAATAHPYPDGRPPNWN